MNQVELSAADFKLCSCEFSVNDFVARLDLEERNSGGFVFSHVIPECDALSALVPLSGAERDDRSFQGFLLCVFWQKDSADFVRYRVWLDKYFIAERFEFDAHGCFISMVISTLVPRGISLQAQISGFPIGMPKTCVPLPASGLNSASMSLNHLSFPR
jgi:hypothetical protein